MREKWWPLPKPQDKLCWGGTFIDIRGRHPCVDFIEPVPGGFKVFVIVTPREWGLKMDPREVECESLLELRCALLSEAKSWLEECGFPLRRYKPGEVKEIRRREVEKFRQHLDDMTRTIREKDEREAREMRLAWLRRKEAGEDTMMGMSLDEMLDKLS